MLERPDAGGLLAAAREVLLRELLPPDATSPPTRRRRWPGCAPCSTRRMANPKRCCAGWGRRSAPARAIPERPAMPPRPEPWSNSRACAAG